MFFLQLFVVLWFWSYKVCSKKREAPLRAISWKSCVTEMWNNLTSLVEASLWLYYRTTCLGENLIIGLWMMNNEDVLYVCRCWWTVQSFQHVQSSFLRKKTKWGMKFKNVWYWYGLPWARWIWVPNTVKHCYSDFQSPWLYYML